MVKKFNIKKIEEELKEINTANDIQTTAVIQLVINNMNLYNEMLDVYKGGDTNKVFLLYQLNGQIFKQLKEFNIMPSSKKKGDNTNSSDINDGEFMNNYNDSND
jgi:hypothetical protein